MPFLRWRAFDLRAAIEAWEVRSSAERSGGRTAEGGGAEAACDGGAGLFLGGFECDRRDCSGGDGADTFRTLRDGMATCRDAGGGGVDWVWDCACTRAVLCDPLSKANRDDDAGESAARR